MSDFDDVDDVDDLPDLDDDLEAALAPDDPLDDDVDDEGNDVDLGDDLGDVDDLEDLDLGLDDDDEDEDAVDDESDDLEPVELRPDAVTSDAEDDADEPRAPGGGEATALVEDDDLLDDVSASPLAADRDLDVDDEVREGEFVCRSCFMAKRESALADEDNQLCRDCV